MARIDLRGLSDDAVARLPHDLANAVTIGWLADLFAIGIDENPFVSGFYTFDPTRIDLEMSGAGSSFTYEMTGTGLSWVPRRMFGVDSFALTRGTVADVRFTGLLDGEYMNVEVHDLGLSMARVDAILRPQVGNDDYPQEYYQMLFGLGWHIVGRARADDLTPSVPGVDFSGDDRFDLRGGNDIADGGRGRDVLLGGRGHDMLWGGLGNDVLRGGLGDDTLFGGQGADLIAGGRGRDVMSGGAGADLFVFGRFDGIDVITDFAMGVDVLRFDGGVSVGRDGWGDAVLRHAGGQVTLQGVEARGFDLDLARGIVSGAIIGSAAGPGMGDVGGLIGAGSGAMADDVGLL